MVYSYFGNNESIVFVRVSSVEWCRNKSLWNRLEYSLKKNFFLSFCKCISLAIVTYVKILLYNFD